MSGLLLFGPILATIHNNIYMLYLAVDTSRDTFAPTEYFLARLGIMTKYDLPYPLARLMTSSVFAIRSSISIDAPKQKVWDVLVDFASYKEWCVPYNSR
jgi:hypothetical protein